MDNKKQTAVEWLFQRFEDGDMYNVEDAQFIKHQALAMEKEQIEQDGWRLVSESTPPSNVELLVQSPKGVNHLAYWRELYNVFTCQVKSESSFDWKWKKF
jgi:hypothetical protein